MSQEESIVSLRLTAARIDLTVSGSRWIDLEIVSELSPGDTCRALLSPERADMLAGALKGCAAAIRRRGQP